jgi:molybdopterin biosynthesis enzyme
MPVADALAAILAGADPLPEEMAALDTAFHRVLARDFAARRTQPPQAMSAMDGYAVRSADAADLTARLRVIGEVAAGRPFGSKVGRGEAVRIFTGGVIPDGTDAVMLSAETSVGRYPVEAAGYMVRIAAEAEASINRRGFQDLPAVSDPSHAEIVADAAYHAARAARVSAIVVFTSGGSSARLVSR